MKHIVSVIVMAALILGCAAEKEIVKTPEVKPAIGFAGFTSTVVGEREKRQYSETFIHAMKASKKFTSVERTDARGKLMTAANAGTIPNITAIATGTISMIGGTYFISIEVTDVATGQITQTYREKTGTLQNIENAFWAIIQKM
ncbi:MAG: hypothetical protein HZC28_18985 [Spirochaetes bacterium]|nr:hypothetical protein [Spirochaetota bacterium]